MAVYVFKCPTHGKFEKFLPIKEIDKQQVCPECGGPVVRVITPVGFSWTRPPENAKPR